MHEELIALLSPKIKAGRTVIIQGCYGLGKTRFLSEQLTALFEKEFTLMQIDGKNPPDKLGNFLQGVKAKANSSRVLLLVDDIDRLKDFSAFLNTLDGLTNVSCVATSDVDIRVVKAKERTLFADRCDFLPFLPLSYLDFVSIQPGEATKKVTNYLLSGGIAPLISRGQNYALFCECLLHFVASYFSLPNFALLSRLFTFYSDHGVFPNYQDCAIARIPPRKIGADRKTILKYTDALVASFALTHLVRVNADYFRAVRSNSFYFPLDSAFVPDRGAFEKRFFQRANIAVLNHLVDLGYSVSVSFVERQPLKDKRRLYEQVITGFLASKQGKVVFVCLSLDEGEMGAQRLLLIRHSFPKIIVILTGERTQIDRNGFYRIGLEGFLAKDLSGILAY